MMAERNPLVVVSDECLMLREEARYLHRLLFERYPPDSLIDAYVRAHAEIPDLAATDESQRKTVRVVVSRRLDAVGIEPWLRGKGTRHVLSVKMLLLAYLAECDASHPEFMRSIFDGRHVFASMGYVSLMAAFRLSRGCLQKVWHGLV